MHYAQFEEVIDDSFKNKSNLLETARCAGAWMKSRGLHISRGYNQILESTSLEQIKTAIIDHCGDHDEESRVFLNKLK